MLSWVFCLLAFLTPLSLNVSPLPKPTQLTPAQFWRTAFGSAPWFPLAGDVDGDGHADLFALGPSGESLIELARTSPLGKPLNDAVALPSMGRGLVAAAAGPFLSSSAANVLAVFADGSIKLVWGMSPGKATFQRVDLAGQIPADAIPQAPTRTAVADFDGDHRPDVMIIDREGRLMVLRNDGKGSFTAYPLRSKLFGNRQLAAGTLAGDTAARCVFLDAAGYVKASLVDLKKGDLLPAKTIGQGSPDDHLVVGHFRGEEADDVLLGQRLYAGGDGEKATLMEGMPPLSIAKDDGVWNVADIDGNGKDDVIRHHEGHERWGAQDVYVHFSYGEGEDKGYYSTANDGLPDVWKTGKIKPGGLDLAGLGCKVGHRDVIVEIERFEDFDATELQNNMNRAIQYFASIPLVNPDGSTGIALHVIYKGPWPMKEHDAVMARSDAAFPPHDRRGVVHTMIAERGGALVSAINGDLGHFNGHWQEFLHEFGHQLDLTHDGFYGSGSGWTSDTGSAIYPSLMSYTYSYGYDNQGEWVRYSDGARASFVLNPRHLSERLPFPFDTVRFLGAEPYHYRVAPTPDGKATLIDWNWNGVLGEEDVAANVKYTHGTDFGASFNLGTTTTAPILVPHGGAARVRPVIVYGQGAALIARSWVGHNRDTEGGSWSATGADYASGIVGDPTAAYLGGGVTWVAYRTARGIVLRKLTLDDAGKPVFGPVTVLARTLEAQPTLATMEGRLAMLVWQNKSLPVKLTMLTPKGDGLILGGERTLDFRSAVPVGAAAGRVEKGGAMLWVGRIVPDPEPNIGRTELIRLSIDPGGVATVASRMLAEGFYAPNRMTLLWEEGGPKLPDGRVYILGGGVQPGGPGGYEMFVSMNTPYPDYGGGWMNHRYRGPGFRGRTAPAACLFEGDIVVAFHYLDDRLDVAFYGTGATPWPTGDFDDIGHIRDYGLSRSIRGFQR